MAHSVDQRVDERLDKLEKLLAEADRKISELNSALQTQPPAGGSENAESSEGIVGGNQPVAAVLRLSREGLDNLEIARRLGMEVGEVELTLNIYRPREGSRR